MDLGAKARAIAATRWKHLLLTQRAEKANDIHIHMSATDTSSALIISIPAVGNGAPQSSDKHSTGIGANGCEQRMHTFPAQSVQSSKRSTGRFSLRQLAERHAQRMMNAQMGNQCGGQQHQTAEGKPSSTNMLSPVYVLQSSNGSNLCATLARSPKR